MKHKVLDKIFENSIRILTILSILILFFVFVFIAKESSPLFENISASRFVLGKGWKPLAKSPTLGIFPVILSTVYISVLSIIISLPIGVGCAVFLSCFATENIRKILKPVLDLLTGIPSVIYGFMGLLIVVKFFEANFKMASGESLLCGAIVLSIMIVPFIISTCDESMLKIRLKYESYSYALGVSKEYMISKIILRNSFRSILASVVLALGRALGETMAVMMVIGNSPMMPKLLGKVQTISGLIALEMGTAEVGSLHYHGLFASGFILMVLILIINSILYIVKKKMLDLE